VWCGAPRNRWVSEDFRQISFNRKPFRGKASPNGGFNMIRRLHIFVLKTVTTGVMAAFLSACAGGGSSAVAPRPESAQGGAAKSIGQVQQSGNHYACPAKGTLVYVTEVEANIVGIFAGKFAGQAMCGHISPGLGPGGLFVQTATHDLYVTNFGDGNVKVYHRGQTTPYNVYTDPSGQQVFDVAVAPDGTVIATNFRKKHGTERGSISTWLAGPNGGRFIGNFPMVHSRNGYNVTVNKNGEVYFTQAAVTHGGGLWKVRCPAGACGAQTRITGITFFTPYGGMQFDDSGEFVKVDTTQREAEIFNLPNPDPKTFTLTGGPVDMALSGHDHHLFIANSENNDAEEYSFPGGKLLGTVPALRNGSPTGIAIDP
jgi:DNA-binding beta-propeller fold protein YncE